MADIPSVSRAASPDHYESAEERPSSSDSKQSTQSTYVDASRGFPVLELLASRSQKKSGATGETASLESKFGQLSIGERRPNNPYANPGEPQKFLNFGRDWSTGEPRAERSPQGNEPSEALTRPTSGNSMFASRDVALNPDASFSKLLHHHFGGPDLIGESLLSSTTFAFAEQYIKGRPAAEHPALSVKLADAIIGELEDHIKAGKSIGEMKTSIDRMVSFLLNKDVEEEGDDNPYRRSMAKLVYFSNEHGGGIQMPAVLGNFVEEGELQAADRLLFNNRV